VFFKKQVFFFKKFNLKMPLFKPKHAKKIVVSNNQQFTLDKKHTEFVNEFKYNDEKVIPGLKLDVIKLSKQLKTLKKNEDKQDCLEKIKFLEKKIDDLKEKQISYYLDNSKHIFEYFETKKKISSGETLEDRKVYSINSFFKVEEPLSDCLDVENTNNNEMDFNDFGFNKPSLLQTYLVNIESSFVDQSQYYTKKNVCKYCTNGEMIAMEDEGIMLCNVCSVISKYLIENEKPSYREPPKEVCFYAYKKINHFKEILAQFQGKESTNIPFEVIQNIKSQIKKERLDIKTICNKKIKEVLKKLKYNKYYEHIPFIKDKLGVRPPIMTSELEETALSKSAKTPSISK
jgi:hypothetical protein